MNAAAGSRKRGSLRPCLLAAISLYRLCPRGFFPPIFCITFGLMRGSTPPPFRIPGFISTPIMRHAASHENLAIRTTGVMGLGTIRNPKTLPILERAIEDNEARVKAKAIQAIAGFNTDASWAILERCLEHHDPYVRHIAIYTIGMRRLLYPDRALPLLSPAAQHPDVEVQKIAIYWLSETRDFREEHLPLLKRCLSSDHKLVRILAAIGLEKNSNGSDLPDTIPYLVQGLLLEADHDDSGQFRAPMANDQYGPYTYVARQVTHCLRAKPETAWVNHEAVQSAIPAIEALAQTRTQYPRELQWFLETANAGLDPSQGA